MQKYSAQLFDRRGLIATDINVSLRQLNLDD